ncbi:MAG: hypothetical protein ACI9WU_003508 [Myxococcota bacterium]|jgi:hypothetical protein
MRPSPTLLILAIAFAGCSEFVATAEPPDTTIQCAEDCIVVDSTRCTDGARERCRKVEGCRLWVAEPCDAELECRADGICGLDACPELGQTQCATDQDFQICLEDAQTFLSWSADQACDQGEACADDACAPIPCDTAGLLICVSETQYQECLSAADELAWSDLVPCQNGEICVEGSCGKHECPEVGASTCAGSEDFRPCVLKDGFRQWGPASPCPAGLLCGPDGACGAHDCGPKGAQRCGPNDGVQQCVVDDAGFLGWGGEALCEQGSYCLEGVCGVDDCDPAGATQCLGNGSEKACEPGAGGFLVWGAVSHCVEGQVCDAGGCTAHECGAPGEAICADDTSIQTCTSADSGWLHWQAGPDCPAETPTCKSGQCGVDLCPEEAATQCTADSVFQLCQAGEGGFLDWGLPAQCPTGEQCKAGVCGLDQCLEGQGTCTDDGGVAPCVVGPDGFLIPGESAPCLAGQECQGAGQCVEVGEITVWEGPVLGRPALAPLANAGFAVAWAAPKSGSFEVRLRRFSSDGQPIEEAMLAAGPLGLNQPFPTVAAAPWLGESAVIVGWLNGGQGNLQLRQVIETDAALLPVVEITPTFAMPFEPWPATLPLSGTLAATLRIEGTVNPASQVIHGTSSDASIGTSPAFLVSGPVVSGRLITGLAAAGIPSGGVWAGWTVSEKLAADADEPVQELRLRKVPADGDPKADIQTVSAVAPTQPAVAVAADGRALFAWAAGAADRRISVQRIGADDLLEGDPAAVFLDGPGDQAAPTVTAVSSGWWVAWQTSDTDGAGIAARLVSVAGAPLFEVSSINVSQGGGQEEPTAATLSDGRVVVAWRDGVGASARVRLRLIPVAP